MHLQADVSNFPSFGTTIYKDVIIDSVKKNICIDVVKIDTINISQLTDWVSIIDESYTDCKFTIESAKKILNEHPYYTDVDCFIFYIEGEPVATMSIGVYKHRPNIGGNFRFGVRKSYQNLQLGKTVLLYGFASLRDRGINLCESIIASKREKSFMLHSSVGFKTQTNSDYHVFKDDLKSVNTLQQFRLKMRIKQYIKKFITYQNKKFL